MKKYMECVMVLALVGLVLTGCERNINSEIVVHYNSLTELMEEVNAEHESIKKPEINEEIILNNFGRDRTIYTLEHEFNGTAVNGVLTIDQAKGDINVLFYNLQTVYGAYEYFGGDEAFESAKKNIFNAIDKAESLTADSLTDITVENLYFIRDSHFSINGKHTVNTIYPYHYREVAYERTSNGYRTIEGKKSVSYIEGYNDLEELFRLSLSDEGDIVYYPVVLMEIEVTDTGLPDNLTVHYENGDIEILTSKLYKVSTPGEYDDVGLYNNKSIPMLYSKEMNKSFLEFSLSDEPIAIVDLRFNRGGYGLIPYLWMKNYTGENVTSNFYCIEYYISYASFKGVDDNIKEIIGGRDLGDGLAITMTAPDVFVPNDNLLIVLTHKTTASAAEAFVDLCHNVNNTLIIGEPTAGMLSMNGSSDRFRLPASSIPISFGNSVNIFPEGEYFEEGRGIMPDLWVPAGLVEEAVINFIDNIIS